MSKHVIRLVRCDACERDEVEEPGTEVVVSFGAGERALDLCERHMKELVEPLRSLIADAGQPLLDRPSAPRKRARAVEYVPCLVCGFEAKDNTGLAAHMRVHKTATSGQVSAPRVGDGTDEATKFIVAPLPDGSGWGCPECGKVMRSSGGLGGHRRTHGIEGTSPANLYYHSRKRRGE